MTKDTLCCYDLTLGTSCLTSVQLETARTMVRVVCLRHVRGASCPDTT